MNDKTKFATDTSTDDIKARVDILQLVGESVPLKKAGRNYTGSCPFHSDKTPSFVVFPATQSWHCFGCGADGDAFTFVMRRDNVDFLTAKRQLAARAGITLQAPRELTPEEQAAADERRAAHALLGLAADWFHQVLMDDSNPAGEAGREYLLGRGFGKEHWAQFRLGTAPAKGGLAKHLRELGADLALAERLGLVARDGASGRLRERFRGRVMIPYLERQGGELVTVFLSGRDTTGDATAKYLHIPTGGDSPIRERPVYKTTMGGSPLWVVEGAITAMAVAALGGSAVAVGGEPTDAALEAIRRRGVEGIILAFDRDAAGQRFTAKAAERLGPLAKIADWPEQYNDLDDWYRAEARHDANGVLGHVPMQPWVDAVIRVVGKLAAAGADADTLADGMQTAAKAVISLKGFQRGPREKALIDAVKGRYTAADVRGSLRALETGNEPGQERGSGDGYAEAGAPVYWEGQDGGIWRRGPKEEAIRVSNFTARFVRRVTIDHGEGYDAEAEEELEVTACSRAQRVRIPGKYINNWQRVMEDINEQVGSRAIVDAKQGPHLPPAIRALSNEELVEQAREIAHTGWVETDGELAYVTPGGVVGSLPEGVSVNLPTQLQHYAVADGGEEAFRAGVDALGHLMEAFEPSVACPAVAFALLPILGRWLPGKRVAVHFVGQSGTQKTSFAKCLMALYGAGWASVEHAPSTWRSTENAIEKMGSYASDALFLVDDYRPDSARGKTFTSVVHRYTDGERQRLTRTSKLDNNVPFRGWLLSTGEMVNTAESSVLARMVVLQFRPREDGLALNEALAAAQAGAEALPTVTARFIQWVTGQDAAALRRRLAAEITRRRALVAEAITQEKENVVNRDRVAENVAILTLGWSLVWEFLRAVGGPAAAAWADRIAPWGFDVVDEVVGWHARQLALATAETILEERPVQVFLDTLEAMMIANEAHIVSLHSTEPGPLRGIVGWFDERGTVFLHATGAWDAATQHLTRTGGSHPLISRERLYKALAEEGMLAPVREDVEVWMPAQKWIKNGAGVVDGVARGRNVRVIALQAGALNLPGQGDPGGAEEPF